MDKLSITQLPIALLTVDPANARTHSKKQIAQIATSIKSFGFNSPILIDRDGKVVAGHGRLLAAQQLKLKMVPTIRLEHLSPQQLRAYALADNRLAELAGWDNELLAFEMQSLLELELDFEITDIGFEMAEIDQILEAKSTTSEDQSTDEECVEPSQVTRLARKGDLWQVGRHLVFCGDALDPNSYRPLLENEKARMAFTDPPYNLPIQGHVSGLGKAKHREFLQASGEMSEAQFQDFLRSACGHMRSASADGAIHFICMDWRHIGSLIQAGSHAYSEFKNLCVWVKPNGGMGSLYRSRHELVAVFKVGDAHHSNNIQLGAYGRYRTNVWEYAGMNSFQNGRDEKLAMHPTVKPVAMIADAILDCSARGDIVLDPFAGSGSTVLAAERTGRTCRAMELDPGYVDVILWRFAKATGKNPVNLWTGQVYQLDERNVASKFAMHKVSDHGKR